MKISALLRIFALALVTMSIGGCQYSPEMTNRSFAYNAAVSRATNQILIANIIRAAYREPRYFTRLGSNSATSTLEPSVSLDTPVHGIKGATLTLGQTTTLQNSLTLENLDDQKYQQGAMLAIDLDTIAHFWNEGIQPDLLGLMFVGEIDLPQKELSILESAVASYCKIHKKVARFCDSDTHLQAPAGASPSECFEGAKPHSRRNGQDYVMFVNDPAQQSDATATHPEYCFEVVLRSLLALGMHIGKQTSSESVDEGLTRGIAFNPRFREEMIKAKFKVKPDDKKAKGRKSAPTWNVESESKDAVLTLDPVAISCLRDQPDYVSIVDPDYEIKMIDEKHRIRTRHGWKTIIVKRPPYESERCGDAVPVKGAKSAPLASLDDLKINLGVRSFEGMVYYLGEIIRADLDHGSSAYPVQVLGRAQGIGDYEERLFVLSRDNRSVLATQSVEDDFGRTWSVPDGCDPRYGSRPDNGACSLENPNIETLTVLTLVDQVWGLKKEPSTTGEPVKTIPLGG